MDLSNDLGTRIEPYLGTAVHIVRSRERRPNHPLSGCPFCVGGIEAAEPYDLKSFANRLGERTHEQLLEAGTTRRVSGVACPIASVDDLLAPTLRRPRQYRPRRRQRTGEVPPV